METEVVMRLYGVDDDGKLFDQQEDIGLDETGGTIPSVGDRIISRWTRKRDTNRRDYRERTILDVKERYFVPEKSGQDMDVWYVVLVVSQRPAIAREAELF